MSYTSVMPTGLPVLRFNLKLHVHNRVFLRRQRAFKRRFLQVNCLEIPWHSMTDPLLVKSLFLKLSIFVRKP